MSHHNLLTMTLPLEYIPGCDKMSRMVLKHQDVVDLITKELLNSPNGTYTLADGDWNNLRCDVLYMSKLPLSFPPVLIEVQNTINNLFLQRLVSYSLTVVKTYHALPVVLVLGAKKISPVSLILDFNKQSEQKPWLLTIPSLIWARRCLIISKETIPDSIYYTNPLNPLLGLSLFLLEQQPSLHRHTYSEDPTIILLYQIAFAQLYPQETYQQNFQSAVETICSTNKRLFESILDKVNSKEPLNKIRRICEKGIHYNDEVKARIVDDSASSQSSDELDFPEPLPMGPQSKRTHTMVDEDI
ncbi:hypothetical protein J3Q64DRAFT_1713059 [Phycomyces blakesleeanus]|uniref:Uncharacterized protein n=2 Tax=Phycomyces blakesleeanus TaxID=4837 RepID=A0A162Y950_PHYB8|nr:hypothetical protein PHYBLDRAFT_178963 [Phycomyces blakesleeanus NRRL 1555(-)]OAD79095.1 hypothetical protein PHYBLDRAFT_178963 [Phycomyces blakesleeanus NRRL 1555(-)]|eukprot:XP_018297135.1 hypothetical protein PHYBLDRAFT_178963 [Phycomyces blakesleeanus NRRL 1555(-)]